MTVRDPLVAILFSTLLIALGFGAGAAFIPSPDHPVAADEPFPQVRNTLAEELNARAAVLYDPVTGRILFAKNADMPLPLASLTKLMAAHAVLGSTPTDARISISTSDLAPEGDSGLRAGDTLALGDLIGLGLVASSNDAMAAAAATLGTRYVSIMNETANSLGLTHTYFLNPTGLDLSSDTSGAYGSARDVALLAASFMQQYPQFFELTAHPTLTITEGERSLSFDATSQPLQHLAGFIGAKTGYTDLAGGNLVAAVDMEIGRPVIAVVLGSTREGRFRDIEALLGALHTP
jgi:D-alanyl-D-alanine carboxypeptidase (penicillin-binding protein 5/6)